MLLYFFQQMPLNAAELICYRTHILRYMVFDCPTQPADVYYYEAGLIIGKVSH